jgi:hypothetical protein
VVAILYQMRNTTFIEILKNSFFRPHLSRAMFSNALAFLCSLDGWQLDLIQDLFPHIVPCYAPYDQLVRIASIARAVHI